MSETKFTKGEWRRSISANGCNHVKCDGRRNGGYIIASTCGSDEAANAHLIAAAPEMYDLLERLTDHNNCKKDIIHLLGEADNLLAKARGEK